MIKEYLGYYLNVILFDIMLIFLGSIKIVFRFYLLNSYVCIYFISLFV